MISRTTERFRTAFARLPKHVQRQARQQFSLFLENPSHPSLRLKIIHPTKPIHSARITIDYRALAVRDGDVMVWFWIGSHAEYDRLLSQF